MSSSRLVPRAPAHTQGVLRAWSLGPLPALEMGERWSLPEVFAVPDERPIRRGATRRGARATLAVLLGVLTLTLLRTDPFSRGWSDPMPRVSRGVERRLDRLVAALASAIDGGGSQSPRGSSSGR